MPAPKIYGEPLSSLYSLLNNLRLKYKEYNKSSQRDRFIDIPDFGIRIRISGLTDGRPEDVGKEVVYYGTHFGREEQEAFGEDLMWRLIASGYMAYIRGHSDGGKERIYMNLIVSHGWGKRILDKRLDNLKSQPTKKFYYTYMEKLSDVYSIYELTQRFPGMFDYLY